MAQLTVDVSMTDAMSLSGMQQGSPSPRHAGVAAAAGQCEMARKAAQALDTQVLQRQQVSGRWRGGMLLPDRVSVVDPERNESCNVTVLSLRNAYLDVQEAGQTAGLGPAARDRQGAQRASLPGTTWAAAARQGAGRAGSVFLAYTHHRAATLHAPLRTCRAPSALE
jgi:hypothetical protein